MDFLSSLVHSRLLGSPGRRSLFAVSQLRSVSVEDGGLETMLWRSKLDEDVSAPQQFDEGWVEIGRLAIARRPVSEVAEHGF